MQLHHQQTSFLYIKITVLDIRGGQVRIGITAPDEVKIHREEVYNRISSED